MAPDESYGVLAVAMATRVQGRNAGISRIWKGVTVSQLIDAFERRFYYLLESNRTLEALKTRIAGGLNHKKQTHFLHQGNTGITRNLSYIGG